jgi:TolB protein
MSGYVFDYDWKSAELPAQVQTYLAQTVIVPPENLLDSIPSQPNSETGRSSLVLLPDVKAPQPYLSDLVDDRFIQLKGITGNKLGWNFLGILENASLAITTPPQPGIPENWLFTGRAIAVNTAPLEAGWMSVAKEEYNGQTYWRVWMKCLDQDGTCGSPLKVHPWDFNSRYSGNLQAFEEGGSIASIPSGFWVDFTELTSRLGWERLPSESNWRSYFPGILFNTFVLRQGLSWQEALLQLYPIEAIQLLTGQTE